MEPLSNCYRYRTGTPTSTSAHSLTTYTAEENTELQHKQIYDLKRNINDELREKEMVAKTANELRCKVKATEAEKVDLSRNIQELRQRVSSK